MEVTEHLVTGFVRACAAARVRAPVADLEAAAMDLLHRWTGERRGYHDVEHLTEVLQRLDELDAATPDAVLAAWFHDAVYDGVPGRDEQRSAELAVRELTALAAPAELVARVAALVRVTADHEPAAGDAVAAALCDADLAVLAADPQRYRRYVDGVRREYAHLPDPVFAAGRATVLRSLLGRQVIYRTGTARDRWEQAARGNLTAELAAWEACG